MFAQTFGTLVVHAEQEVAEDAIPRDFSSTHIYQLDHQYRGLVRSWFSKHRQVIKLENIKGL